jgi:hypothetical protein
MMLRPQNRPVGLRAAPVAQIYAGGPVECRADLRDGALQLQIDWLTERGATLRAEDQREVGELLDECATLNDPADAKKYHRYATECTSGSHRAHKALRAIARATGRRMRRLRDRPAIRVLGIVRRRPTMPARRVLSRRSRARARPVKSRGETSRPRHGTYLARAPK